MPDVKNVCPSCGGVLMQSKVPPFDHVFDCLGCNEIIGIRIQPNEEYLKAYPAAFVMWYSGMELKKIDAAFERWKRETKN